MAHGLQFYGSLWQPEIYNWAFNVPRADIKSKWEQILSNTDVLVVQGIHIWDEAM